MAKEPRTLLGLLELKMIRKNEHYMKHHVSNILIKTIFYNSCEDLSWELYNKYTRVSLTWENNKIPSYKP